MKLRYSVAIGGLNFKNNQTTWENDTHSYHKNDWRWQWIMLLSAIMPPSQHDSICARQGKSHLPVPT